MGATRGLETNDRGMSNDAEQSRAEQSRAERAAEARRGGPGRIRGSRRQPAFEPNAPPPPNFRTPRSWSRLDQSQSTLNRFDTNRAKSLRRRDPPAGPPLAGFDAFDAGAPSLTLPMAGLSGARGRDASSSAPGRGRAGGGSRRVARVRGTVGPERRGA